MKDPKTSNYRIFTDATADMGASMLEGMPEITVIPMGVEIGEQSFLYGPGGDLTIAQFYALLHEGKFATTSQINPETYRVAFSKALDEGYDVLYLGFSSGLSGSVGNAMLCMNALREVYPEREMICIDTLCASVGEGMLVREAARMQRDGMSLRELADWVNARRLKMCHWFTVDSFDHLRHGGRVSAAVAVAGSLLNIKPLLHVDDEGRLQVVKKPRGRQNAMREQLEHLRAGWTPEEGTMVVVGHADALQEAETLRERIRAEFPQADVHLADIGPVIGAHTGPGMLALIYWGSNR